MSKFFKALEKVDHERDVLPDTPADGDGGLAPAECPVATHASAGPAVLAPPAPAAATVEATVAPVEAPVSPFAKRKNGTTPPVVDRTPVERAAAERARAEKERADREREERERAEKTRAEKERAERERAPVYGAPTLRDDSSLSRRGFAWQMDGQTDAEPGEVDDHLVSLLEPTSFAAEQYRAVRLAIETFRHERGTRVVAISSPGRGDGKTVTAINLAGALAQAQDARVVLVEADLRHPGVARYLGLPAGRGLSTYLLDSMMTVDAIIERPAAMAFAVVAAGAASSMPYELLKSPRLAALFAALRDRFDYVVVDTPPVLPFPDVGILRDTVDGFVLVVRANRTPREMLRDSMSVIGRNRGLGLVFNDDDRNPVPTFADDGEGGGWRRYVPRPLGGARVA